MDHFGELTCRDCNMIFRSVDLLDKHRHRFCIGSVVGNPKASWRKQGEMIKPGKVAYRGIRPRMIKTPDLIRLREQKEKLMKQNKQETNKDPSTTNSLVFSKLTEEFQKLRMSVEESLPRRLKEGLYCGSQCVNGNKLQENHEQKLAEIRVHTTQLEAQREEIERQLAGLSGNSEKAHLEELLQELKGQEERNEEVLHHLVTQINGLQGVKEAEVISVHVEDKKTRDVTCELISCVDGPLSSQIRSLCLAYMQNGGSNPEVLAHLHDLQAEALALEQIKSTSEHRPWKRRMKNSLSSLDSNIVAVEHENLLLEEEILRMQIARERNRGKYAGPELDLIQRHHVHQMSSLRRELERSRVKKSHPYTHQQTLIGKHDLDSVDTLGPAPYDPVSGLVIFYDMVLDVAAMFTTVFLVARLFTGGQEIARPTPLPPVQCQRGENFALVAVKQPVLGVQPSPSLSLVVEVQAVGGFESSDQEIQGWTKLHLFDQHNQVQNGFWKLPVRSLPVGPSLNPEQLNSLPQLCKMELCVRVVNARDEDVQSLIKIHPNNSSHYKYPPRMFSHSAMTAESQMQHVPSNPLWSSVSQNQHEDSSPAEGGQDEK
ncbi:coiled-coil domain-containing protein 17 [Trichomycterus rosablanca]|uniref:coiled-coil domain-containing protein 17 n=1 Tax=Trichomycterus rosablanca TaxID=2290929 RepID=UPI002F35E761